MPTFAAGCPPEIAIGRRTRSQAGGFNAAGPTRKHGAPPPGPEQQLVEKLRRIEALHARPGSEGERHAAERARERIQSRLKQLEAEEPPIEFRFSLADQWSRHLFLAVLRRYVIPLTATTASDAPWSWRA